MQMTMSTHSPSPQTMQPWSTLVAPSTAPALPFHQRVSRASEIIPRLYISDLCIAESAATLSALGVTHVLSAMRGFVAIPTSLSIHHAQLPLDDFPFAELAAHLPTSTGFLVEALRDPNARVLVHCAEGISRSVSVVAAFLMAQYGWTPAQAIQFVKSRRKIADPNPGFVAQLHEYEDVLRR